MRKRFLIFINCLLWMYAATAQDITWGPVLSVPKNTVFKTFMPAQDGFYIVRTVQTKSQQGIYIEKYNQADLSMQKQVFFPSPLFTNGRTLFEKIMLGNNRILWYVSNFDRVKRRHELYQVSIDLMLEKATGPIAVDAYDIASSKSLPGFSFHTSSNKKYNLIIRKFPFDKYANEKYYFMMYDSVMNELWKKEIELPYANNIFDITERCIDLSGNIHMLATLAPEKQKGELFNRSIAASKYLLISYYPAENKVKEFEINLDGKYITAVTAGVNPAGDIAIGGFYSNTNSFTLAGTFYLTMSPQTKNVISLNQKPFEKEFLMEFMSERNASRGEELYDFYFDHFILNADGSALLVAEEYFRQTYTYFDPYNQLYYDNNTYNFNSIIVVKVNNKGEIDWTRKVSKRQVSSTGYNEYYSYGLAKGEKNLYLMFNDHSGNLKKPQVNADDVYALTHTKFSVPVLVTLQDDGAVATKTAFYKLGKDKLILLPSVSRQINGENYLVCRQRKNNFQFGIFKLN